jgi:hypothetical protein
MALFTPFLRRKGRDNPQTHTLPEDSCQLAGDLSQYPTHKQHFSDTRKGCPGLFLGDTKEVFSDQFHLYCWTKTTELRAKETEEGESQT